MENVIENLKATFQFKYQENKPKLNKKIINILLVEDNAGDVILVKEAIKECGISCNLYTVNDGEEAMFFLFQQGNFSDVPRPDIILLDLNLPKMGGIEVLKKVKKIPQFQTIPIIVLTTSSSVFDINGAYENSANCFLTKPLTFDEFIDVFKMINSFWFSAVKLPVNE